MAAHVMTARRRVALRKAQLASARKRRKNYGQARRSAARSRNLQNARSGSTLKSRRAQYRKYDQTVIGLRQKHLGHSRRRAVLNQKARKSARVAGRTVAISAIVAPVPTAAVLGTATKSAVTVGRATPHAAKGFGRGLKQSSARRAAARRNFARTDFHHATVHRIPQQALPHGTGKSYTGRKVRGY